MLLAFTRNDGLQWLLVQLNQPTNLLWQCFVDGSELAMLLRTILTICHYSWLLGVVTSTTLGGLIHILLVVMIVMIIINLVRGRSIS